jgi:hypothetical protein
VVRSSKLFKTRSQTPTPLESPRNGGLSLSRSETLNPSSAHRFPNPQPSDPPPAPGPNHCATTMRPPPKKPNAALPVPKQLKVHHPENESLSRFFLEKWRAMMQEPEGLSQNNYLAFANANRSLCSSKEPIRTLKDFSNVK